MDLYGIPITDDQCIGDTLPALNNALTGLHAFCHMEELSAYDLYSRTFELSTSLSSVPLDPQDSYSVKLYYNTRTGELSADALPLSAVNSSTIKLNYNSRTGVLSADSVNAASLAGTKVFPSSYNYSGSNITYGLGTNGFTGNVGYPTGQGYLYNGSPALSLHLSAASFTLTNDSLVTITDNHYWVFSYTGGSNTTLAEARMHVNQTFDISINNSAYVDMQTATNLGSNIRLLNPYTALGGQSRAMGGCISGTASLTAAAGTILKFKPKFRANTSTTGGSQHLVNNYFCTGSHTVTIQPL